MIYQAQLVVESQCVLGEGPVWDDEKQLVYWVDIDNRKLCVYSPNDQAHQIMELPEKVGCFARTTAGDFIVAGEHGISRYDERSGSFTPICDPEKDLANTLFNDGKCDPAGRFLAGTASAINVPEGALYVMDSNGTIRKLAGNITCSNGIAWSVDNQTMYYIDSMTQVVVAYDYDITTGNIANPREVISYRGTDILPDGMTSDEEGMLWVAEWGGWKISRWNPATGARLATVEVPAKHVTSCVFGGPNMDEIYITTARCDLTEEELADQPLAGGLFRVKVDVKGQRTWKFKVSGAMG